MATGWVLNKVSEALAPTVSNIVSTAGGVAGDVVCGVGNSINGVGDSISSTIRRYGDAAKNTGNGLKDFTGATGGRAATATNPLGLSDSKVGGRLAITNPSVPKPIDRQSAASASSRKGLPSPASAGFKSSTAATVKPSTASPKPRPSPLNISKSPALPSTGKALGSAKGSAPSPALPSTGKALNSAKNFASSPASKISPYKSPSTPAKTSPNTKKVTYSARPTVKGNTAEAKNPLGL